MADIRLEWLDFSKVGTFPDRSVGGIHGKVGRAVILKGGPERQHRAVRAWWFYVAAAMHEAAVDASFFGELTHRVRVTLAEKTKQGFPGQTGLDRIRWGNRPPDGFLTLLIHWSLVGAGRWWPPSHLGIEPDRQ